MVEFLQDSEEISECLMSCIRHRYLEWPEKGGGQIGIQIRWMPLVGKCPSALWAV
jgi:hypothetical protein